MPFRLGLRDTTVPHPASPPQPLVMISLRDGDVRIIRAVGDTGISLEI
jgi:hypothetical protein